MARSRVAAFLLAMAVLAAGGASSWGIDLPGVLPAAADQPQINTVFYLGDSGTPQMGTTEDPLTGDPVTLYNAEAYLDTGASGILLSTDTAQFFSIPNSTFNNQTVTYSDVGVAGTGAFTVSDVVHVATNNHVFNPNDDLFSVTQPDLSTYSAPSGPMRLQLGPNNATVNEDDPVDDIISGLTSIDVVGMPAIKGKVMVLDPKPVNNFNAINDWDFESPLPDIFLRTYLYAPGTPFTRNKVTTAGTADPGIPTTSHHIKLSYGSFDQFTTTSPGNAPGPTLEHNPFIGKNPVDVFEGKPTADVPGIKISRTVNGQTLSSEGNWLLDTGAAASIISQAQAGRLGVSYKEGTFETDTPDLVDQNGVDMPSQFTVQIQGVGGIETLAGFYLDSMLLRTMEGNTSNDNDPHHIRFLNAPVLVGDITLTDPVSGRPLTLDGIFGMNYLIASLDPSGLDGLTIPDVASNYFDWVTFDEPNGILGVDINIPGDANGDGIVDATDLKIVLNDFGKATSLRAEGDFDGDGVVDLDDLAAVMNNMGFDISSPAGSGGVAPEPASIGALGGGVVLLMRRRRHMRK